jgi:uncharacterized protein (DUF2267 family)
MTRSGMTDQDRYEDLLAEISGRSGASAELAKDSATQVLCVLGERVSTGAMEALLLELPTRLAEQVRACGGTDHEATGNFGRAEFFRRVEHRLGPVNAEAIVKAVFEALLEQLPRDCANKIASQLPPDLREHWHPPTIMETVDRYGVFLADLAAIGALPAVMLARASEAVLCTLERCLPASEDEKLYAELPEGLKALVRRCTPHQDRPPERLDRVGFLRSVGDHLNLDGEDSEHVARAVLAAARSQLTEAEIRAVADQLPPEIAELWRGEVILERFESRL